MAAASVPPPATWPALTWLNTVNGSQAPIAGLRTTMMFSTKSAQMRTPATVITWARNSAPSATPNVVIRPGDDDLPGVVAEGASSGRVDGDAADGAADADHE